MTEILILCVSSLLVLGLRNMEGSCDPTKLVSQFLLRKTLVQVRRRILQCCRPGFPDNIVKVAPLSAVFSVTLCLGRVSVIQLVVIPKLLFSGNEQQQMKQHCHSLCCECRKSSGGSSRNSNSLRQKPAPPQEQNTQTLTEQCSIYGSTQ